MTQWRKRVDEMLADLRAAKKRCRAERHERDRLDARTWHLAEATVMVQGVAEQIQHRVHRRIAEIVTECLAIFDEPYTFQIRFKRARGKTEAQLVFVRDGLEVDPLEASGGGVVDVAAFALRVACLVLRRPPLRRLLVMDEPMKFVSAEYRPRVRAVLESLADDLGCQIVMVTHDRQLQTGKVVEITP